MTCDRWKTRSPDDGQYDPTLDEPPSREQEEADYLDEQMQRQDYSGPEFEAPGELDEYGWPIVR